MTTESRASRAVHKITLTLAVQTVDMPIGSRVVAVESQHGHPCVWFECDPTAPSERRTFASHGTGHLIPPGHIYAGTAHDVGGQGLHVYERPITCACGEFDCEACIEDADEAGREATDPRDCYCTTTAPAYDDHDHNCAWKERETPPGTYITEDGELAYVRDDKTWYGWPCHAVNVSKKESYP